MVTKRCSRCKRKKNRKHFSRNRSTADGLEHYCRDCKSKLNEQYRLTSPGWTERNRRGVRKHYRRHRQRVILRGCLYQKRLHVRLRQAISGRVRRALKTGGSSKAGHLAFELVGYSVEDLMRHLEKQFKPGMSWSNYGQWEIDHKKPVSKFLITGLDDPELRKCWALSNLQPLWKHENLTKAAKC